MNINRLKSLVAAAKGSEHLYEQQAAAMEFTLAYGEQLIALVEAGQRMRLCITDNWTCAKAWDAVAKEGDV